MIDIWRSFCCSLRALRVPSVLLVLQVALGALVSLHAMAVAM